MKLIKKVWEDGVVLRQTSIRKSTFTPLQSNADLAVVSDPCQSLWFPLANRKAEVIMTRILQNLMPGAASELALPGFCTEPFHIQHQHLAWEKGYGWTLHLKPFSTSLSCLNPYMDMAVYAYLVWKNEAVWLLRGFLSHSNGVRVEDIGQNFNNGFPGLSHMT